MENFSRLDIYNADGITLQNITVRNLTSYVQIRDSANLTVKNLQLDHIFAFYTDDIKTSEFSNIKVNDTLRNGDIRFEHTNYSTFHDIIADGIGYPRPVAEGDGGGLNWYQCTHNTGYNLSINDTGWSGFAPGGDYGDWSNVTVHRSGHNGIDLHNIQHTIINNAKIYDSISNNIVITAGYVTSPWSDNITLKNIYSYNSGIVSDTGAKNIYIENVTQEGNRDGMGINAENFTLINATFELGHGTWPSINTYGLGTCFADNVSLIDANVYTINNEDHSTHNKIINCKMANAPEIAKNKTEYYYADIAVQDQDRNPLSGNVKFSNEVGSDSGSVDGYGNAKQQFSIGSAGRTYLPTQNRAESPTLVKDISHTAKITSSDNLTVSLRGIKPDPSWYRSDPNTPTYTITAIIPRDSDKTHIIGFAPNTGNPFNLGEKKNFRVWTDGNLTGMKWLVYNDNNEILTNETIEGVLNYTWTVSKDISNIEFSGVDANGNEVIHTWYLGDGSGDKTTNQTQVIKFFPESTALTKNTGESVTFNVNYSQLLTTNWLINGKLVQSNATTMTKSWNTSGTYNVTFSGYAIGKSVLHSWLVDVIDPSKTQNESIVAITPEYQVVSPGKQFAVNITVEPGTAITGAQSGLLFQGSMANVNRIIEGNLFSESGAKTYFSNGTVDNSAGLNRYIYCSALGNSSVSSPGILATTNLTAGSSVGIAKFNIFNVTISDSNSSPVPNTIKNASVLIDTAPVLGSIGPKSVNETNTLNFKVNASDVDGNNLTFSASGLPAGGTFNQSTRVFTWVPSKGQAGNYTVTFKVSDGYLNDAEDVKITVKKLNNPPVITSLEPANGSTFNNGENVRIALNASDADNQALSYTIKIDGKTYSTSSSYVWEINYSSSGNHTIEMTVNDGIEEVKKVNTVYINDYHSLWDVKEDGIVDILDITLISRHYGEIYKNKPYPRWDVNQDGVINIQDLYLAGDHFGETVN